mgnify:CR=1 FL=1
MNSNQRLNGAYQRLEHSQGRVTPPEVVIIIRDMHNRLSKLEEANEKKEHSTSRRRSSEVPAKNVSSD